MDNENKILEMLGALTDAVSNIQMELKDIKQNQSKMQGDITSIKSQVMDNTEILNSLDDKLNNLEGTNGSNHIEIKGHIEETKETVDKMETSLELVKIATVANSKDIEKLTIVR